jgi:hypothetical protein
MKTMQEIIEYAKAAALVDVFSNTDSEEWPDNPMELLESGDTSDEAGDKKMFAWEPFQYYPPKDLLDLVESFMANYIVAMQWAKE